jgi:hypothetical protein
MNSFVDEFCADSRCPTLLQLLVATVAAAGAPSDIRICSGLALFRLWVRLLVARVKAREGGELPIAPHCLPGQPA